MQQQPLVSVYTLAYNHKPFLDDYFKGVMMQQTTFPFEVVIHDDASPDGSEQLIRQYAAQRPDIIHALYETENQYSRGGVSRIVVPHLRGKYIAICEGDDYWIDPLKLQKEVDFLESHPDYSMVFTGAKVITSLPAYRKLDEQMYDHLQTREYTGAEIFRKWSVPTASVLVRREVFLSRPHNKAFMFGDIILFLWAAQQGRIYCIADKTVVYRRHSGSATTSAAQAGHFERSVAHYQAIAAQFGYNKICHHKILDLYAGTFVGGKLRPASWRALAHVAKHPSDLPYFFSSAARLLYTIIRYK